MKKILLIACGLALALFSNAQAPLFQWTSSFGGGGHDFGNAITTDAADNAYSAGTFTGSVDFDPGAGTNVLTASSGNGIFISKLDGAGNFVWAKCISASSFNDVKGISLDASGNVYVMGTYQGTVDLDPGAGTFTSGTTSGSHAFLLKLDGSGNFAWAKIFGGTSGNYGYGVEIDASGNIYACGSFFGTTDFDPGAGIANVVSAGNEDGYIVKLDPLGNYLWSAGFGGAFTEKCMDLEPDPLGDVYACGFYQNSGDFDPGAAVFNLASAGSEDGFIIKLTAAGNFAWAKSVGGAGQDFPSALSVDATGNSYITGLFQGTADYDPGASVVNLVSAGFYDFFVLKLNAAGNYQWAHRFGGISSDGGNSLKADSQGNNYITGSFGGTFDFDPGPGTAVLSANSSSDAFILKLDATGNFVWAKNFGSNTYSYPTAIAINTLGSVYSTGNFGTTGDFDPDGGVSSLTSSGGYDAYVHKMKSCSPPSQPSYTGSATALSICNGNSTTLSVIPTGSVSWYSSATSTTSIGSGTVLTTGSLSPGTYTYYAEALTCTTSLSRTAITVTVYTLPTIGIAGNSSVCAGQTVNLTASGGVAYSWNTTASVTAISVSPPTTTVYIVNGTDIHGCSNTASINVTVHSLPNVSILGNSVICAGETATLTANGALTYSWSTADATTLIVINPSVTTVYTATGFDSNGCSSTFSFTQHVDLCTGVQINSASYGNSVYPNPNSGSFVLELNHNSTVTITTFLGQVFLKAEYREGRHLFDLKDLSEGVYFIKITQDKHEKVFRMIKN